MTTALMIIDMQMDMQKRINGGRDHVNPEAADNIAALAAAYREAGKPIIHVRHREDDAEVTVPSRRARLPANGLCSGTFE